MTTCRIQWIDHNGRPTPDNNEAIGSVYCEAYFDQKYRLFFEQTEAFPICAQHLERMNTEPGMQHWKVTGK